MSDRLDRATRGAASPEALIHAVLHTLSEAMPLAGGVFYEYDAGGELRPRLGSLVGALEGADRALFTPAADPSHAAIACLAARPRIVFATRGLPRDAFRRSAAYERFYGEHRIDHIACLWLNDRKPYDPGMRGVMVARSAEHGAFGESEARALWESLPLLATGARALPEHAFAPVVRLDSEGRVTHVSDAAAHLLRPLPLSARELGARLAGPLRRWQTLRAAAGPLRFRGSTRLFQVVESRGRAVYVEATAGERGFSLRLLTRAEVPRLAELQRAYGLSPAELSVLQAIAMGLSNVEAAEYLCVSPDTVKSHVGRSLHKLGLSSRLQAGLMMQRVLAEDATSPSR